MALALEVEATLVLIDEKPGRVVAKQLGLKPLGTLGMLIQAKKHGLLPQVRATIDRLQTELDF